jgi:methylaspartate ammonia-lyase
MATVDEQALSGSTNGRPVKIVATATAGTLIHTATAGAGGAADHDRVFIYLHNNSAAAVDCTVEFGGVSADDLTLVTIAAKAGPVLVVPGIPLQNSLVVRCFAASANVVMATGYIHRVDK